MTVECVVTKTYTCGYWGASELVTGVKAWSIFSKNKEYFRLDGENFVLLKVDSGNLTRKDFACVLALAAKIMEDHVPS